MVAKIDGNRSYWGVSARRDTQRLIERAALIERGYERHQTNQSGPMPALNREAVLECIGDRVNPTTIRTY